MDADLQLDDAERPRVEPFGGIDLPARALAHGQHLVDVHDMYRAELDDVQELVELVRDGRISGAEARSELAQLSILQRDWALACARYCVAISQHHGIEDHAMFPALADFDERLQPVIDRLGLEHQAVHELVLRIDRALHRFARGESDSTPLEELVLRLAELLRSHFRYEEEQLVQPLARMAAAGASPFG